MTSFRARLSQHLVGQRKVYTLLAFSCLVSVALLCYRFVHSGTSTYLFMLWNLFLAAIPLGISRALLLRKSTSRWTLLLAMVPWLLFFPNAPYIFTDLPTNSQRNSYVAGNRYSLG